MNREAGAVQEVKPCGNDLGRGKVCAKPPGHPGFCRPQEYACGHCGRTITIGCYCSKECANADE